MKDRRREVRLRETRFLMSFDVSKLNGRLIMLLSVFIALNFLDALTTLVAINAGAAFVEHNPLAAGLFNLHFGGFLAALALKYMPVVPLVYATYVKENASHPLAIRIVKVSAFVALVAANIFYLVVVGSNLTTLVSYYHLLALG